MRSHVVSFLRLVFFVLSVAILLSSKAAAAATDTSSPPSSQRSGASTPLNLSDYPSSSTASVGLQGRSPRYDLHAYLMIVLSCELGIWIVTAAILYHLPTKILTRLVSRMYGYELAQSLYRSYGTHKIDSEPLSLEKPSKLQMKQIDHAIPHLPRLESQQASNNTASARTYLLETESTDSSSSSSPPSFAVLPTSNIDNSKPRKQHQHVAKTVGRRVRTQVADVYLHTRPHSLWVMSTQIDFNEVELEQLRLRAANEPWSWKSPCYFLKSAGTGQCFGRHLCSAEPSHRVYRIRSYIRQMLLWAVYVSLCLLWSMIVLRNQRYHLSFPDGTPRSCPDPIMNTEPNQWDCYIFKQNQELWYFKTAYFVDCSYDIDPNLDVDTYNAISCFKFVQPDAETTLQAISMVAALFTLVFGGATTLWGWVLGQITNRRTANWMYAIPVAIFTTYFSLILAQQLHTSLALMSPIAAIALTSLSVSIRKAVGFRNEQQQQQPPQLQPGAPQEPQQDAPKSSFQSDIYQGGTSFDSHSDEMVEGEEELRMQYEAEEDEDYIDSSGSSSDIAVTGPTKRAVSGKGQLKARVVPASEGSRGVHGSSTMLQRIAADNFDDETPLTTSRSARNINYSAL